MVSEDYDREMKIKLDDDNEFGKRIKSLRLEKGFTIKDVSQEIGVAVTTYREWENGRAVSGFRYLKLAQLYNITVYELLGFQHHNSTYFNEQLLKIEDILKEIKTNL